MKSFNAKAPLRARLHWYKLTCAELVVLTAMCEHSSDGASCRADPNRLAAYSKLSERTVWNIILGYDDPRSGKRVKGLLDRGILTQLAPGNWKKRKCAIYRINEAAMHPDPRMDRYRDDQEKLPGIERPWEPKISEKAVADPAPAPASDLRPLVQPLHQCEPSYQKSTGATVAVDWCNGCSPLVQPLQSTGATVALDSRSIDSRSIDSKPEDSKPHTVRGVANLSPVTEPTPAQPPGPSVQTLHPCETTTTADPTRLPTIEVRRETQASDQPPGPPVQPLHQCETTTEPEPTRLPRLEVRRETEIKPAIDVSGQVHEIASLYPKIHDAFHLPREIHGAIAAAIGRDGRDLVWAGTKGMAEEVANWPRDQLRYLPSALRFFSESQYRKHPTEWERRKEQKKGNDYWERCERERAILHRMQQKPGGAGV